MDALTTTLLQDMVKREGRSLLQYVSESFPWTPHKSHQALPVVLDMAKEEHEGAAQRERLKHKGGDVHIAHLAAVGDLLHLHDAVARGAPGLVGVGLLLELALEVGRTLLELIRPVAPKRRGSGCSELRRSCLAVQRPRSKSEGGGNAGG